MYCRKCGSFIKDTKFRCEKCGVGVFPLKRYNKVNITSIVGLVISAISFFISLYGIMGVIGVITSYISLKQIIRFVQKGRGIAILGILTGIASLIYTFFK